jgi:putative ABC transport system permease protein
MRTWLRLYRRFILRALARERLQSFVTVLGIALGVAVVLAIRLANTGVLESFRTAVTSVAGETSLEIRNPAGRIDELRLRDLEWLRDYGRVSPVVEAYGLVPEPGRELDPEAGEFLQILGVDILRDRDIRRYRLLKLAKAGRDPTPGDFFMLLSDPKAIVLTEKFAEKRGIGIGDPVPLVIGDREQAFMVRGLLLNEGPGRAFGGQFALMDIAAAQEAFGRLGYLDRVDLKLHRGIQLETAESDVRDRLPEGLAVSRPQERYGQVENMIEAFHFNLNALGSLALLVGLFLIYNTVSVSVISRRREIGILRAAGVTQRTVLSLFLGQAAILAAAGSVIGIGLGRVMATGAVKLTSTTVQTFYVASAAVETVSGLAPTPLQIALAVLLAMGLSLAASIPPALEASRVHPVEAMRGARRLMKTLRPSVRAFLVSAGFFAAGLALSRLGPVGGLPLFGYLSAVSLMFGGAFLVPNVIWLLARVGAPLCARLAGLEGRLAASNLGGAIPRIGVSVAALAVALAMTVSITVLIESFRTTLDYWVERTLRADIYSRPVGFTVATAEGRVSAEAIERMRQTEGVAAVATIKTLETTVGGKLVTLGVPRFDDTVERGRLLYKAPDDAEDRIRRAQGLDRVAVSESFSLRYKKDVGDFIDIPTPAGPEQFRIVAVYYDYSSNRGTVLMDRETYFRHFPKQREEFRPSSLAVHLEPGADPEEVCDRLVKDVGARYRLTFRSNQSLREEVDRIFNSTFRITYALEAIAVLVAGLGVIATLIKLILERRREIAVLRFLGATRSQVRRMVVVEAVLLGAVSQAVGILIGVLISIVLVFVINVQSFGWTLQFHFPWWFLVHSTLFILAVSALAGLYPAGRAERVQAVRYVSEE